LSRERGELQPLVEAYQALHSHRAPDPNEDREALTDPICARWRSKSARLESELVKIDAEISLLLCHRSARCAQHRARDSQRTGGEEPRCFAADLFPHVGRYAERKGWNVQVLSTSQIQQRRLQGSDHADQGERVYSACASRAACIACSACRRPEPGRIHTSTGDGGGLPEADEVDVQINEGDLEIPSHRVRVPAASVNMTNSAVQIFHKPSAS